MPFPNSVLRLEGRADKDVMNAWDRFVVGAELPQIGVRRLIEDSWRRSLNQGVDPRRSAAPLAAEGDRLESLQRCHAELIEAAQPVMDMAGSFLTESGTMMVLTDPSGVVLCVAGDARAKDSGNDILLSPGGNWGEAFAGTNAIGTTLAHGQPVQVSAAEHYCEQIKRWTCSANVIRDPFDGSILGALDVSGLSGSHNGHCLALAVAGTSRIEARLNLIEMEKRARLLDLTQGRTTKWHNTGIVIFDRRGRLIRANPEASVFLDGKGLDSRAFETLASGLCTNGKVSSFPTLPHWLKRDWLEPVLDQDEKLGTVLTMPMPSPQAPVLLRAPPQRTDVGTPFADIIGSSDCMVKIKVRAQQIARLNVPVLLLGPTGAGKEVFARALHLGGPTQKGPFVPLNCGSMTRDLLASELFGYTDGAFTGARRGGMAGKFEAADRGTLFLDEVGEMPLDLQAHFLRVLEDGEVYRLGEARSRKVSVRIIAATNRDLRKEVAAGRFRMDLFYRLAVTLLRLPRLSDHKDDIPHLVEHFTKLTAARYGVAPRSAAPALLDALCEHDWPGNVRELRNVIESMVLLAEGDMLTLEDLPEEFLAERIASIATIRELSDPEAHAPVGGSTLADCEKDAIMTAIRLQDGNLTRVAASLGIAKSTLYEKMKRYDIGRKPVEGTHAV